MENLQSQYYKNPVYIIIMMTEMKFYILKLTMRFYFRNLKYSLSLPTTALPLLNELLHYLITLMVIDCALVSYLSGMNAPKGKNQRNYYFLCFFLVFPVLRKFKTDFSLESGEEKNVIKPGIMNARFNRFLIFFCLLRNISFTTKN